MKHPVFGIKPDLRSLVNSSIKSSNLVSQNAIKLEGFAAQETIGRAWTFGLNCMLDTNVLKRITGRISCTAITRFYR